MGLFLQHFKSTQTIFLNNQEKSPGCLSAFSALPFTDSDTNELLLQKGAQGHLMSLLRVRVWLLSSGCLLGRAGLCAARETGSPSLCRSPAWLRRRWRSRRDRTTGLPVCMGVSTCPVLWGNRYTLPSEVCGAHTRLRCKHSEWQALTARLPPPPKQQQQPYF